MTVDIARLPLHEIPNALKHDGAPPLYYYLLHFWIVLFGQSNDAVRSFSGIIAVLTLPVGWLCGKRFGGRPVAWTMLVLLASAPFAVYYATESRMYALVILLTGLGFLALQRAVTAPRPGNLIAVALDRRRAPLHAVLVALPRRHRGHLADRVDRAHPTPRPPRGRAVGGAHRARRGLPALRPVGADVPVSGEAHRDAVGGTAQLLRRHQRAHRVHRQPGLDVADGDEPGPPARRHLLRHAGAGGLRRRPHRPHHRARPAHPAAARAASASSSWGRCSRRSPAASSRPAPSPRAMPPWCSCRFCSSLRWARRRC